jgi:lipid A oxidase
MISSQGAWRPAPVSRVRTGVRARLAKPARAAEVMAAFASAAMIIVAAATPDDTDVAHTANSTAPASTAFAPGREIDAGAYLGVPYHYPSDFWLKQDGRHDFRIKDVNWYTNPFANPVYYGVRIQRWGDSGRFGTMIDFTHGKAYAPFDEDRPFEGLLDGKPAPAAGKVRDYFSKLEWSHGHNMLTLNGLFRVGVIGRISPYAGAGAGISLPHSEIHLKTDPARTYEYQYTGFSAQALFGVELRLASGSVSVEYKFTTADYDGPITHTDGSWLPLDLYRQFSRWRSGEAPPGGWAGAKLTSHQAIGGFMYRFVPQTATR